jgi:hypothetical protein
MSRRQPPTFASFFRGLSLPDRSSITDWARGNVKLSGGYARQGAFDIRTCRHLEKPFAMVQREAVREVKIRAAVQTLKTLFLETCSLWAIANEPGPMMWTMQDDDSAKEHVKSRYAGLLKACEPVAALLPRNRHDKSTCEIYFADFFLLINGANLNNLQSKSIRWKLNSECWLWKQGLLEQAARRVSAYERDGISKIINEGQGSWVGDDFDKKWLGGTQEVWGVPCAGCSVHQPLDFFSRMVAEEEKRAGVTWAQDAKREDGTWNENRVRETVRWVCRHCGHEHESSARKRAAWNAGGAYLPGRADADGKHCSFAWNALLADDLGNLAIEYLDAMERKKRGDISSLTTFYQQRLALPWRDEVQDFGRVEIITLSDYTLAGVLNEPLAKIPNESHRLLTVDVQRDHFWAVVRAWATGGGSRLLWRGKVNTTEQIRDLETRFGIQPQFVMQDAQYSTAAVYEDCVRFGWTALHGSGDDSFTHLQANGTRVQKFFSPLKTAETAGGRARYMFWASDPVKDMLAALFAGRSYPFAIAADAGPEYLAQLQAEAKRERINKNTGRSEWRWVKTGANHMRDCEAMQVAVALALGILPMPEAAKQESKP